MNEQDIFIAALQLKPALRGAFLEEACGTDARLRSHLEKLLEAHARAGSFLDEPAMASPVAPPAEADFAFESPTLSRGGEEPTTVHRDGEDEVGAVIAGKYKLMEEIGEGGMGTVFMAQQTEPVRRAVAVKVIKSGMDSKAVLARFDAERQALAMMDHPNIAKVLDAGTTESGRPFFVMELVKGVPITQFCDDRKLTPRQRLELFVPVCNAIQHAHQKGVIHRDIKPSNVLVALYDDRPVPKVIDFGVAKATGTSMTDKTFMTGYGAVVGTPEYMSPEQASLNNLDIDTRSDVYSLGVLLYELLTGSTPVDRKSLGKAAIFEILRIVREVEAPRPSARLSSTETLPNVAAKRSTEPAKLSRLMKGELDWVLLKALEKDRTRRYETANGLARDIQRYLADELVEARPPSAGYRMRKFVRKHKGRVVAVSLVAISLVAGIVGTAWQANRAEKAFAKEALQRSVAEENERDAKASEEKAIKASEAATAAEKRTKLALDGADKLLDLQMENGRRINRPFTPDETSYFNELTSQFAALTNSETGPAQAEALTRLATVQAHMGLVPEMAHSYNSAIQIHLDLVSNDPVNSHKHRIQVAKIREKLMRAHQFQLGVSASTMARETLKLADADWQAACLADPKNPAPLIERAQMLSRALSKPSDDIELFRLQADCFSKLVTLKPGVPQYHRQLSSAYTKLIGTKEDAKFPDQLMNYRQAALKAALHSVLVCENESQQMRFPNGGPATYYFQQGSALFPYYHSTLSGSYVPFLELERTIDMILQSKPPVSVLDLSPDDYYRRIVQAAWTELRKDFADNRNVRGIELLLKLGEADAAEGIWGTRGTSFETNQNQLKHRDRLFAEALALARHPECKLPPTFLGVSSLSFKLLNSPISFISLEEYVWFRKLGMGQPLASTNIEELKREFTENADREVSGVFHQRLFVAYIEVLLSLFEKSSVDNRQNLLRLAIIELERYQKSVKHDETYFGFIAYYQQSLWRLSELLLKNREYQSAIELDTRLINFLEELPENDNRWKDERYYRVNNYFHRANSRLELRDWEAALADYRVTLKICEANKEIYPASNLAAMAHFRIGMCLQNLKRYPEADAAFDEAIRIRRTEPSNLRRLSSGRDSVSWFTVVAEHDRATQNELCGRWDEAIKRAKEALKTLDQNEEVYVAADAKYYRYQLHSIQARCLRMLNNYQAAASEWDMAKKFARPDQLQLFYIWSGQTYALVGRSEEAFNKLIEILPLQTLNADDLYGIVCAFALCSGDSKIDKDLSKRYQDRAMEVLQRAVKAGFNDHAHMKKDTDMDPLRNRDDYKKLIAELEKKFPMEKPAAK